MTTFVPQRWTLRAAIAASLALTATPALADAPKIDGADTAWMTVATGLVLMMTIPGLALFYSGMVRKKNVLATMAQSLASVALVSVLWMVIGYSLAFTGDAPYIGSLRRSRSWAAWAWSRSVPSPRPSPKACS